MLRVQKDAQKRLLAQARASTLPLIVFCLLLQVGCAGAPSPSPQRSITEFAVMPSSHSEPISIAVGPDGALWFTNFDDRIGRITVQGKITEFVVPTPNSRPTAIIAGPDGALWFTEAGANKIGRIMT